MNIEIAKQDKFDIDAWAEGRMMSEIKDMPDTSLILTGHFWSPDPEDEFNSSVMAVKLDLWCQDQQLMLFEIPLKYSQCVALRDFLSVAINVHIKKSTEELEQS